MCLAVYVASDAELPTIAWIEGWPLWAERVDGHKRPACLAARQVRYVGAHTKCGCGFLTGGVTPEAGGEDHAKVDASLTALQAYVEDAAKAGPVEVFACWEGAQADARPEALNVTLDQFRFEAMPFDRAFDEPIRFAVQRASD